jgi:hypothetical protein
MAKPTIYTRATKGSALTWTEGDANITNLQTAAVPDGGATGEYLVKNSATNWDFGWTDRVTAKTIYENVKNVSGGSLAKGTPVYQVGVTGAATVTVGAARADDPTKLAIGVLDQTIADEAEGTMTILGEIKGVNTSGFTVGDAVYLGATGGYTNVKPTATDVAVQFLGVVFRVDASNGSGFITGTLVEDSVRYTGSAFQFWDGSDWVSAGGIALTDLSVGTEGTASGDGSIAYNNTTGVFTYTPPVIPAAGISDVVADTTPQLGGNLDVAGQSIVSTSNGNINITPNGTGGTVVRNLEYQEFVHALGTTSGTIAPNAANGNVQTITLNGNLTINGFTSPVSGQTITLVITTGGTGRTLTSTMLFAGGSKTLSTTAAIDILTISYIGTTYYASLVKDYK